MLLSFMDWGSTGGDLNLKEESGEHTHSYNNKSSWTLPFSM